MPPLEVIAFFLDGATVSGKMTQFAPAEGVARIAPGHDAGLMQITLSTMKSLHLAAPIPLVADSEVVNLYRDAGGGEIAVPASKPFAIDFVDGEMMHGRTRGFVRTRQGLFVNLLVDEARAVRVFVPTGSVKAFRIGGFLGQALVELGMAEAATLDRALDQQARQRAARLGERLVEARIASTEALEAALAQQRATPQVRLGEVLVARGMLSRKQLVDALAHMRRDRRARLGEILVESGIIGGAELSRAVAHQLGIPMVTLKDFTVAPELLELVPEVFAREHRVLPLLANDTSLAVAVANPLEADFLDELRFSTQRAIVPFVAEPDELAARIGTEYALYAASVGAATIEEEIEQLGRKLDGGAGDKPASQVSESDSTLVRLVNKMILDAQKRGASDIHVEAYPDLQPTRIRFRIDGAMTMYLQLPSSLRAALVSRLKIMANMDISEHRKPQDGKIDFSRFAPTRLELRVASLPTANNLEDVVMRLLSSSKPIPLEKLGVSGALGESLSAMVHHNYGLILVCGPTGSGKTTTLHSLLAEINTLENKIWTAEDPIEITHEGLRQIQINPRAGLTFATAMRAFLRADPDIIMVGEMRDAETTRIAIEASLTGHLVLSTLHTNSAPESVVRLLDLGIDPFNFADALIGVLSQRLARRLCASCRQPYVASEDELDQLAREYCADSAQQASTLPAMWRREFGDPATGALRLYRAAGCDKCHDSGYRGRVGLYELMGASPAIKRLIQTRATVDALFETATGEGMLRLKQYGIVTVLRGDTDLRSVRSACA